VTIAAAVVCALCSAAFLSRGPDGSLGANQLFLFVGYGALGLVVWRERRERRLDRRVVLGLSGGLLVLAVVVPPTQSGDVWAYAMYGRIVSHHHSSPYTRAAADYPRDPAAARVDHVWQRTKSVYGPAFTWLSAAGMRLAGSSRLAARLLFQIVAALAIGVVLFLIDRRGRDPLALACIGLNPVIVLGVVNNAHNDALIGLAILGAVLLAHAGRPVAAGLAGAAGALVKLSALLPMAAVGWWLWRRRGWRPAAALGIATLLTVALVFSVSGGRAALKPLSAAGKQFTGGSIWNGPQRWVARSKTDAGVPEHVAHSRARAEVARWAALAVVALAVLLVWRRLRAATPASAVGAAVLGFMLGAGYVYPWYAAWSLPTLALEPRSRLTWLVAAHAAVLQFVVLRDPSLLPGQLSPLAILPASQRLMDDVYRVGFPLLQMALIVSVVGLSLRPRAAQT
jgi:alpha-1,6-mannosyltransferase